MLKLPKRLQNDDYRFIRLNKFKLGDIGCKAPLKGILWKDNLLKHNDPLLIKHINNDGNIGWVAGPGNIRFFDIDSNGIETGLNIKLHKELKTCILQTGSGNFHMPVKTSYSQNHRLKDNTGEYRADGQYIVCPPSKHPKTGERYKVYSDIPIAEIDEETIDKILGPIRIGVKRGEMQKIEYKGPVRVIPDRIDALIKKGAVEKVESRNLAAWIIVKELYKRGFERSEIEEMLLLFNDNCKPPKPVNVVKCHVDYLLNNADLYLVEVVDADWIKNQNYGDHIDTDLQTSVHALLLQRNKDEATELLVSDIENTYTIHTVRSDEKDEMWIYSNGIYVPNGKSIIKEHLRKILGNVYAVYLANLVIEKIKADTFIESEELFEESSIEEVPVQNGILNIFTRILTPFTPKKRFFNKLPVTYDVETDCPAIKKHLNSVLVTKDDVAILQEIAGYSLLRDSKFETAFIWFGDGSNGKGKTQELFKRFVGVENVSGVTLGQLENNRFSKSTLHKKLLNMAGEIGSKPLKDTEAFKAITGRDLIQADRKFREPIKFINYAKPIFSANKIPITQDRTPAFWRRWIMVIFPYTFMDADKIDKKNKLHKLKDPEIISKITTQEELDGFLNFALDGLDRLMKQKRFTENRATKDIKNYWIRMSNSFEGFFMDYIELDYESREIKTDVQRAYLIYCRKFKIKPMGTKDIKEVMYENGVGEDRITIDGKKKYVWLGLKLKEESGYEDHDSTIPSNSSINNSFNNKEKDSQTSPKTTLDDDFYEIGVPAELKRRGSK